jgi:Poly(R)-hydroxyalkanoic acid synthase subunit (PHA_synth_III_E)
VNGARFLSPADLSRRIQKTGVHVNDPFSADAYGAAAERFYELLKTFGASAAAASGNRPDWSSLTAPLAGQFEQWLKMSQFAAPWLAAAAPAGAGHSFESAAPAWLFGALPLGPAAASPPETQRILELLGKLAQQQGQLALHWSEIANSAARGFVTRLGKEAGARGTPEDALRLYELWVESAEKAYGQTVRKPEFCQLQAEMANTSAALLVEQRRQAEGLVRAFGLPTRSEVDALYGQLKELRQGLADVRERFTTPRSEPPATAKSRPARVRNKPRTRRGAQRKRRSRGSRG